jgi:uncharacterized damage-inducible protein DinB
MLEKIIRQCEFNFAYAEKLVEDIGEDQMAIKPAAGLDNHPAFTLGHLATAYANLMNNLTGEFILPAKWKELFLRKGPGDPALPEADKSLYPSKAELLAELKSQQDRLVAHLRKMDAEKFSENFEWRFAKFFPTYGDRILFLCVNHAAMHLGQLAAWRRAMGFPSALAAL